MNAPIDATKHRLFASDFDRTLSFNDPGVVPSERLILDGFHEKAAMLAGGSASRGRGRNRRFETSLA